MFDSIARRYDFLNHFLSLGIDRLWRRTAVREIGKIKKNPLILDVATGTGDLAIEAIRLDPAGIMGIDISPGMLEKGKEKIHRAGLSERIMLMEGSSEAIPFQDMTFDVAMAAFGVRNFAEPLRGLSEMRRVLRNDGMIMILEFSRPSSFPFRNIFNFYFLSILPFLGQLFSRNGKAYRYLPESVMRFPENEQFLELLRSAGFCNVSQKRLTGGVASIYTGHVQMQ